MILAYRHGRYVEATSQYRQWLRPRRRASQLRLRSAVRETGGRKLTGCEGCLSPAIEQYCIQAMLEGPTTARRAVLRALPGRLRHAFRRRLPEIERVFQRRKQRVVYPRSRALSFTVKYWEHVLYGSS